MDIGKLLNGVLGSASSQGVPENIRKMLGGGQAPQGVEKQSSVQGLGSDQVLSGSSMGGIGGGLLGGVAASAALNMLMGSGKSRKKLGGSVIKYGGAALLAGLAYKAWQDWKTNQAPTATTQGLEGAPAHSGFVPEEEKDAEGRDFRLALLRTMIGAAKSDGHVDSEEYGRIKAQINAEDLDAEEKGFLLDEFAKEPDPEGLARMARTQEQGAEMYLAARLAVDPDDAKERDFLERLGQGLKLPQELVVHLDARAEAARLVLSTAG